jgi:DNA-binding Xre family transcriptional regulator
MKKRNRTKIEVILFEKKISQMDLFNKVAEISHTKISWSIINNFCSGKIKNVHINTLMKICFALQCSPNDILDGEDYKSLFKHDFIKVMDNA